MRFFCFFLFIGLRDYIKNVANVVGDDLTNMMINGKINGKGYDFLSRSGGHVIEHI